MKTLETKKSGSVLLLTLLVVSLLLMIVLSFSVYVRMELRSVSNRLDLAQARQNAKLGMNLALAQLQKAAGPDQRVTARADILGNGISGGNRLWTGVWEVNASGSVNDTPTWLVSGLTPNPTVDQSGYEIFPAISSGSAINLSLQPIKDNSNTTTGNYAYWVSDEGVKASLAKYDQEKLGEFSAEDRGLTPEEMDRLPQITPGRTRNEFLFSFTNWDSNAEKFKKIAAYEQLVFAGLGEAELVNQRHRTTWRSRGVLANSESGGLKQDLSFIGSDPNMDKFSESTALQSWVQNRTHGDSFPLTGSSIPLTGEPIFSAPLVLTEFGLYMRISRLSSGNSLRFQVALRPELWNPFGLPIEVTPEGTEDLIFEISGLPELSCAWVTGTDSNPQVLATGSFNLNPNNLTLVTDSGKNESLDSVSIDVKKSSGFLEAGEVYRTSLTAELPIGETLTSDSTSTKNDDYISIQGAASQVTIRIKTTNGDLLQEFVDIPFPEFNTTGRQSPNDDLSGRQVSSRSFSEFQVVFHFRLDDETVNIIPEAPLPIEHWFSGTDPRSISMPSAEYNNSIVIASPDDAAFEPLFQSQPDLFVYGFRYFPAFDIPTTPPISVGSLQHLQFASTPPYAVGNTWGNQNDADGNPFNSYFDRYFFSTVPQGVSDYDPLSGAPLANGHLLTRETPYNTINLASLKSPFSSKQFLIDGAFNINCTDPLVWKVVLGSLNLTNWDYAGGTEANVQYGIFHLPFGINQYLNLYSDITGTNWYKEGVPVWKNAFTVGMRELSEGNLTALVTEITNSIKSRGKPFSSIREFADSGLLQNSIDATNINSPGGGSYSSSTTDERIPAYAPAFISQADILQLIAPFSLARSDTFIIRAYGNKVTGTHVNSEQVCEAVVQRISEPTSFRNPADPSLVEEDYIHPPDVWGRRFKIISFTWLN